MNENIFKTEQEISEFLDSRPTKPNSDYGIDSLLRFPYKNVEMRFKVCEYLTDFLKQYPSSYDSLPLRRHMVRIAPFLESAGYIAAIEPLMRIRNRLEAELDDVFPTRPDYVVAIRNAIETLQRLRDSVYKT